MERRKYGALCRMLKNEDWKAQKRYVSISDVQLSGRGCPALASPLDNCWRAGTFARDQVSAVPAGDGQVAGLPRHGSAFTRPRRTLEERPLSYAMITGEVEPQHQDPIRNSSPCAGMFKPRREDVLLLVCINEKPFTS